MLSPLCFTRLSTGLSQVTHLYNFLLSASHDKYLHRGTTSIYIMSVMKHYVSYLHNVTPHNNRGSYVSPSANWKCIFSQTQKTSTRRRQLIHIKQQTTNKHKNISNTGKREMQNEKQQRITLQMMHVSAKFNLYWFFSGWTYLNWCNWGWLSAHNLWYLIRMWAGARR